MSNDSGYILSKRIARGGMAEIFLAKSAGADNFERICAVKRILPHYAQEGEYIDMFRSEASICKRLQHANIVQVYDFKKVDNSYAIIMEFVDGADLRSLLAACEKAKVRLTVPMAVFIAAQVARGLHYAHTRIDELTRKPLEIVHRDISPQNLLISYEGEVKLIDFGIAKFEEKTNETKPGVVKGKYSYMSPEQVSAKRLDARTDVFSLCIVLWEILAMKRLFAGQSEVETIKNVQNCTIRKPLCELNSAIDETLSNIISKGLSKDRKRRYQSAAALEKDLSVYLNSRHPDFTATELGNFTRRIFAKKRTEMQKTIQSLLANTQTEKRLASPIETMVQNTKSNASAKQKPINLEMDKNVTSLPLAKRISIGSNTSNPLPSKIRASSTPRTMQKSLHGIPLNNGRKSEHSQRPINQFRRKSPNTGNNYYTPRKSSGLKFVMSMVAISLLAFGYFTYKKSSAARGSVQLVINTIPNRVSISVDGKYLGADGKFTRKKIYHDMPKTITLPSGRHRLRLHRQSYLTQQVDIEEGRPGTKLKTGTIRLKRDPRVSIVPLNLKVRSRRRVYINLDNGLYKGNIPALIKDIRAGKTHTLVAYPNYPKKKGGFKCSFTPRKQRRKSFFTLEVQVNKGKRSSRCIAR